MWGGEGVAWSDPCAMGPASCCRPESFRGMLTKAAAFLLATAVSLVDNTRCGGAMVSWREAGERDFPLVGSEETLSKFGMKTRESLCADVFVTITEETK